MKLEVTVSEIADIFRESHHPASRSATFLGAALSYVLSPFLEEFSEFLASLGHQFVLEGSYVDATPDVTLFAKGCVHDGSCAHIDEPDGYLTAPFTDLLYE